MKKLLALMLVLMITFACPAFAEQVKVMTSFYPIHIFALNVFNGIDDISVECMTAPQTGCLHDYQLIVSDMMKLAKSNLFVVCGAGMEMYLEDVKSQFPQLPIIDTSSELTLLENCSDDEEAKHTEHHDHDHSVNPHAWLSVENAIQIVDTIANAGMEYFPVHAQAIAANADAYRERLLLLKSDIDQLLSGLAGKKAITFHEAFSYIADDYGLDIAAVIMHEEAEALSPAQIAETVRYILDNGTPPLFADLQSTSAAAVYAVAQETGAKVYAIDPIVTGEVSLTAYEDGMRKNAQTIADAFE